MPNRTDSRAVALAALVGLQIAILAGMFWQGLHPLLFGEEVAFRTRAYDPRDLLSGNYAQITYDFNQLYMEEGFPTDVDRENDRFDYGDELFLELEEGADGYSRAVGLWKRPPEGKRVLRVFVWNEYRGGGHIRLRSGMESFFAPEEEALTLDSLSRRGGMRVTARVTASGASRIVSLEPAEEEDLQSEAEEGLDEEGQSQIGE